jgi:hypothetical protein
MECDRKSHSAESVKALETEISGAFYYAGVKIIRVDLSTNSKMTYTPKCLTDSG